MANNRLLETVATVGIIGAIFGGVVWMSNQDQSRDDEIRPSQLPDDRAKACRQVKGQPEERVTACLKEVAYSNVSGRALGVLKGIADDGKVLTTVKLEGVANEHLDTHPELRELLMSKDEAAAAKALRDKGIRGFVVHRDLTGALDRDNLVLARLAYHDHLEWFQLRYVSSEAFVYTVRNSHTRVPLATADAVLAGLRARLEGRKQVPRQSWNPDAVRIIGAIRLQGKTLATRHAVGNDLEGVLNALADKLRRSWDREVEVLGVGSLEDRMDEARLEIHIVMERAPVEPRGRKALFELWQMGIDGMLFQHREGAKDPKFTYYPGSELVTNSHKSADEFLREGVRTGGWRDLRPWEDRSTQLDLIRDQHFMEEKLGGGKAVRLIRGVPEVTMESLTDRRIRDMLVAGGEWWLHNMFEDGSVDYKYWPAQNRRSDDYNEVRHILAARDLSDTWRYRNDDRYLAGARKNMDWLMRYAVFSEDKADPLLPHPVDGSMLFRYPARGEKSSKEPNQKLGTVAVALLGWVAWADATGNKSEDENIRKMAKFVLSRLESNGKFDPYYVHRQHGYYGQKNDIVPGEAALALGMVAEYFGEPNWVDFYPKFVDFYQPWFRERSVRQNPYGRWPHATYSNQDRLDMVQFGPWSVMAAKQYHKLTGDERAASFGLEVADWMIDNYEWSQERSPWPDFVGGYYKLPNETPAMQSFCYSEGTAAAYQLASTFRPEAKDKYDIATRETIRFLDVMQYDETDAYFLARPDKVYGGIKYTMNENKIRIDYVGHGLSTLSQYLDAREFDPAATLNVPDPKILDTNRTLPSVVDKLVDQKPSDP